MRHCRAKWKRPIHFENGSLIQVRLRVGGRGGLWGIWAVNLCFLFISTWVVFMFRLSLFGRWCESFPPLSDSLIKLENHVSSFSASTRRHVCRQLTAVIYCLISSSVVIVVACYFKNCGCCAVINALLGFCSIVCAYKLKNKLIY